MRNTLLMTAAVLAVTTGVAAAASTDAWLDIENCGLCKNLTTDKELFAAMEWDTKLFANGLMEVTTVPVAYEARFQKLMGAMEASGAKMMAGEKMDMCGMCQSYGAMMMAGVTMDQMQVGENHISIISSRDPKVVEMIRAHGQTTIDEMVKWKAAESGHGHSHGEHPH
jgi:hypothetical protein